MFKRSWVFCALYLAVPVASLAKETKTDSYTRIDLHPDCYDPLINNLLANCGFEDGNFNGWVQSGNPTNTSVVTDERFVHSGTHAAAFGPPTLGFIAQTVPTTPGRTYTLSFFLMAISQPNEFQVRWDTYVIADLVNVGDFVYTQYTYHNLGTFQMMTEIKLGFSNVLGFFYLDDVVLEPD